MFIFPNERQIYEVVRKVTHALQSSGITSSTQKLTEGSTSYENMHELTYKLLTEKLFSFGRNMRK